MTLRPIHGSRRRAAYGMLERIGTICLDEAPIYTARGE
jgi:hypothetical protein